MFLIDAPAAATPFSCGRAGATPSSAPTSAWWGSAGTSTRAGRQTTSSGEEAAGFDRLGGQGRLSRDRRCHAAAEMNTEAGFE